MTNFLRAAGLILCLSFTCFSFGQSKKNEFVLESLINQYVNAYDFSSDNRFKLAAYSELKGYYDETAQGFILPFGGLGKLTFYRDNCLLKTYNNQVFYLDRNRVGMPHSIGLNEALSDIFERIELLSNYGAPASRIEFVNKWLARKNMEPFDKIFTRHLFLKYGKFDPNRNRIEFHTDWLPDKEELPHAHNSLIRYQSSSPLKLLLDSINLRGYYTKIGGYVYVEDVNRNIQFASGEEYTYNGSAFKLFVQKMLTQSAQYVIEHKAINIPPPPRRVAPPKPRPVLASAVVNRGVFRGATTSSTQESKVKPLYDQSSWIPMMLGMLKANNVEVTDPDVIIYFIDQPFFPKLYNMLSREEKQQIDRH